MKIVDINPFFYPLLGGIEHRMHLTCKELVKRGHDVTILTGQLPGTELEEKSESGYKILRLPSKLYKIYNPPYITSKNIAETLESLDADIVNFNYRWAPSYSTALRKYDGAKVFTSHNTWGEGIGIQTIPSRINDEMFRRTMETFDHIIAVSDYMKEDLMKHGFNGDRISVVNSCLEKYPVVNDTEDDFILSLGRLVRVKGLDYLIEAMQSVDQKLIICGKGPDTKRLEKKISKYGLEDKVKLLGWVSEEDKERYMGTCKFFVMPSLCEAYGLAAVELMAYGKPVVCTNVNGLPGTVLDGGVLVEPRNAPDLANAINDLLSDKDRRIRVGKNARIVAESRNCTVTTDKIEEVYNMVLSKKNSKKGL